MIIVVIMKMIILIILDIKFAQTLSPEGGPGAEIAQSMCGECVGPKAPHIFLTLIA